MGVQMGCIGLLQFADFFGLFYNVCTWSMKFNSNYPTLEQTLELPTLEILALSNCEPAKTTRCMCVHAVWQGP